MAADQQVIQSYLIKLGYSVDKLSQRAAEEAAGSTGRKIAQASSIVAAGIAGVVGLGAAATVSMNNLYYAAQRAGTAPLQFRAYTEAFSLIGGQAEALSSTLQNIGSNLASNPASRVIAAGLLGRDTTDSVDALNALIDRYNQIKAQNPQGAEVLQRNLLNQFATLVGADPAVLRQILFDQGSFRSAIAAQQTTMRNTGLTAKDIADAARLSNDFKFALSGLYTGLMKVSTEAFPPITARLEEFAKWFRENPDEVREAVDSIGSAFRTTGEVIKGFSQAVGPAFEFFKWLSDHGLLGIVGAGVAGGMVGGVPGAVIGATGAAAYRAYDMLNDGSPRVPPSVQYSEGRFRRSSPDPAASREALLTKFQSALGLTREQAAAIVGNLEAESNLNPSAFNPVGGGRGAQGIAQWRGDRLAGAEAFFGGPVSSASIDRQADYVIRELLGRESASLQALRGARGLSAQVTSFREMYERPGISEANDAARLLYARQALGASSGAGGDSRAGTSRSPYVLAPNVSVTINGAGSNAREIGNEVEFGLRRMYSDWNRNLSTVNTPP